MIERLPLALLVMGAVIGFLGLRRLGPRLPGAGLSFAALVVLLGTSLVADTAGAPSQSARLVVMLGASVVLLMTSHGPAPSPVGDGGRHAPAFTFLALCLVWCFSVNVLLAQQTSLVDVFGRLAPLLAWACVVHATSRGVISRRDLLVATLVVFAGVCVWSGLTSSPWAPCSQFKCGPADALFTGPMASENSLGRFACFAALAALALRDRALSTCAFLTALTVLVYTGSRTAQLSLGVALVAWLVWRAASRPALRNVVAVLAPAGVTALGLWLVYHAQPSQFSNRGGIWQLGVRAVGDSWIWGSGLDNWSSEVLARNYMHSQALLLLFSGGAVAVAFYVFFLISVLRTMSRRGDAFGAAVVVLVLAGGLVEIMWNPLALDGSAVSMILVLVALGSGAGGDARHVPPVPPGGRRSPRGHLAGAGGWQSP